MSINTLQSIHALGVNLALDDFGTGYTAFSQLGKYPIDTLKVDKSFIDHIESADTTQTTIIKAIIAIAQSFQLKTIAEGIEEVTQYHLLADLGCDMMQGYLFAKPMPWTELKHHLTNVEEKSRRQSLLRPETLKTTVTEPQALLS